MTDDDKKTRRHDYQVEADRLERLRRIAAVKPPENPDWGIAPEVIADEGARLLVHGTLAAPEATNEIRITRGLPRLITHEAATMDYYRKRMVEA